MDLFRIKKLSTMAALILSAASCSVKEDRGACPSWLRLDVTGCTETENLSISAWNNDLDNGFSETIRPGDYPEPYEHSIGKGHVTLTVVNDDSNMTRKGSRLVIPAGNSCGEIWAYTNNMICEDEFVEETITLHKQFARVYIKVKNPSDEPYPFRFTIEGDVNGIDLDNLSPSEGLFVTDVNVDEDNIAVFYLPRQTFNSRLRMVMRQKNVRLENFPLDEWIAKTGYDWTDQDLEDIYIGVDCARASICISISGWEEGNSMNIEF